MSDRMEAGGSSEEPRPPAGWQYGVITEKHVWGCGDGEDGRRRQRMRLRHKPEWEPCFLPLRGEPRPDTGEACRLGPLDDGIRYCERCGYAEGSRPFCGGTGRRDTKGNA